MEKYKVTNIQWDADGQETELPKEIKVKVPKALKLSADITEYVSDYITAETGFCHFGFNLVKE